MKMPTKARWIELYWDFYGPNAGPTATHFNQHLTDFLRRHGIDVSPEERVLEGGITIALALEETLATGVARALRPRRTLVCSSGDPAPE